MLREKDRAEKAHRTGQATAGLALAELAYEVQRSPTQLFPVGRKMTDGRMRHRSFYYVDKDDQ